MAEVIQEMDKLTDAKNKENFKEDDYKVEVDGYDSLEKELERTLAQESRHAKLAASVAGTPSSNGEEVELGKLANTVNFSRSVVLIGDAKQLDGVENEVQQIAHKEKVDYGLTQMADVYRERPHMLSIPWAFLNYCGW